MRRDRLIELYRLWRSVNRGLHELARDTIHGYGLPMPAMAVMRQLLHHPGATISDLARHTRLAKSHVSKTVDHLVESDMAEKQPDAADKRLVRIQVTAEARELFSAMHDEMFKQLAAMLANKLSDSQVDGLIEGLQALERAIDDTNPGRSRPPAIDPENGGATR